VPLLLVDLATPYTFTAEELDQELGSELGSAI
jgi:hypothetical protein